MEGDFEELLFGLVCFALYQGRQITILETFLEDPQEILKTLSKGLDATIGSQELSTILHLSKLKCNYSIESLVSRPELTDMEPYNALDCIKNPFAGA
jgi:hypothetical protein